jgi:hypothetical protein
VGGVVAGLVILAENLCELQVLCALAPPREGARAADAAALAAIRDLLVVRVIWMQAFDRHIHRVAIRHARINVIGAHDAAHGRVACHPRADFALTTAQAAAVQRIRGQAGPQHDALGARIAGVNTGREDLACSTVITMGSGGLQRRRYECRGSG